MPRLLKIALPIMFLAGASAISLVLVQSRPSAMQKPPAAPALLVSTVMATREPVTFTVESQGAVTPRTQTTLVSEVAGQIIEVSDAFVVGGFFESGDVLLRIDPRNYQTRVKSARAELAKSTTQVATENALADYALDDWKRLREFQDDPKVASDLTLRKPQLAAALAELEASEADLEMARRDLERTVIRAPYDGMVSAKRADIGQYVNSGTALVDTFAIDYAEVRLPLNQRDLEFLELPDAGAAHTAARVTLTASIGGEDLSWPAHLVRTEGVFDAQSRVLYAVAQVQDPYQLSAGADRPRLRIGTFVSAEISGRSAGDLFVLPRHALYREDTMWVVDSKQRIQSRQVTVLKADDDHVYIDVGLEEGDVVCISPIDQPLPGTRVRIAEAS